MRLAVWALLALAYIALVYFVASMFKYSRMISTIFLSLVYKPDLEPIEGAQPAERVSILDSADHEVQALFAGDAQAQKLVVFCHESGASKEYWEKYAYFLPPAGWAVLSPDLNIGGSSEANALTQWPTEEAVQRVLICVRWARRAYPTVRTIVLFGVSNGADIALAASVREPGVAAVVVDGLFSMKEVFRDYIRKWAPVLVRPNLFGQRYPEWIVSLFANLGFWRSQRDAKRRFVDVEKLLAGGHPPLLMIHGERDDYVPETHRNFLAKRVGRADASLVVPRAGHNEAVLVARRDYEERVLKFVSAWERRG